MFRRLYAALAPTFRYWSQTEVHVYAFSVAANVLLAFFPFLIVMMSLSRVFFSQPTTLAAIDLALRDYFPDALGNFLQRNLPQRGRIEILFLIYFYLPNGRPPLARVVAAAIGVGLLMEVLKYLTRLIWPWFFTKLTREYGVFKYSVTLILIGFLASMLVLAGAEWAARGHRMDNPR